jgi:hypothetical protein
VRCQVGLQATFLQNAPTLASTPEKRRKRKPIANQKWNKQMELLRRFIAHLNSVLIAMDPMERQLLLRLS